jgi:hypothetical protein
MWCQQICFAIELKVKPKDDSTKLKTVTLQFLSLTGKRPNLEKILKHPQNNHKILFLVHVLRG